MITAIVNFKLAPGTSLEEAAKLFRETAHRYQGIPGLIRKHYLFDPETGIGGGSYLWETRAAAEAVYTDEWKERIKGMYGQAPDVRYFETPVIVDNETDTVLAAE